MRVMPHSHTLTVSTAWTISRPLGLHVDVGACAGGDHTQTAAAAAYHTLQGHRSAKPYTSCHVLLAVVVVVNSLTPRHYQCTYQGYSFVADLRYRLIHEYMPYINSPSSF